MTPPRRAAHKAILITGAAGNLGSRLVGPPLKSSQRLRLVFSILLVVAGGVHGEVREIPVAEAGNVRMSTGKLALLALAVQKLVDDKSIPGAMVLVALEGRVVYSQTFGQGMQPDSIVRIASMTKPVTAVATMILYDQGRFRLDDPVGKHLPALKGLRVYPAGAGDVAFKPRRAMTIRDLLRHTSGIAHHSGPTPVERMYAEAAPKLASGDLQGMVEWLGTMPLLHEPGVRWYYGLSYEVLARLVEVLSGQSFDAFVQQRIFDPLDMRDTSFFVPEEKLLRFAALYGPDDTGGLHVVEDGTNSSYRRKPTLLSGGRGLVSTARDYLRFCQMLLGGGELHGRRLLRKSTVKLMTSNRLPRDLLLQGIPLTQGMGFGLGFAVVMQGPRRGEYAWGGSVGTNFWISPQDGLVALTLTQCTRQNDLRAVVHPLVYQALLE